MIAIGNIVTIFTNGNEAVIYTNDGFHKRSYFIIYHKRPKTIKEFCDIENAKTYEEFSKKNKKGGEYDY